jgi:hypothetical protein
MRTKSEKSRRAILQIRVNDDEVDYILEQCAGQPAAKWARAVLTRGIVAWRKKRRTAA